MTSRTISLKKSVAVKLRITGKDIISGKILEMIAEHIKQFSEDDVIIFVFDAVAIHVEGNPGFYS